LIEGNKMKRLMNFSRMLLIACLVLALGGGIAYAQDRRQELQESFKARDAELRRAKQQGLVGETTEGLVAAVEADRTDEKVRRLIDEENRDRRELYQLIAAETNATPEVVAEQNARRNYQRARAGEYLRTADGEWRQKK
jgi:uncharacterized protein